MAAGAGKLRKMPGKFFYKSVEIAVFDNVYPPSDDSTLLANAITEADAKGKNALDMGCGTGIQGLDALLLGAEKCTFSDIDENALANARENAENNGFGKKAFFKKSNLFSALKGKKFWLIIFNPPYVDSGKEKKWHDTDGGKKGRETLDAFLKQAKAHLLKDGKAFFVQSSLNGEVKTKRLLKKCGFSSEIVARKRIFFEELVVFRAWRT